MADANPYLPSAPVAANPYLPPATASSSASRGTPKPPAAAPATHDHPLLQRALGTLQWAASSPVARGLDAVLGAPQRFVAGTILDKPGEWRGIRNLTHPAEATDTTHDLEAALGFGPNARPSDLRGVVSRAAGVPAPKPNPVRAFVDDLATESVTDPVMYVPGLNFVAGAGRIAKLLGATRAAEAASRVPLIDRALSSVVEGRDLRKSVTRAGEDIVKGREGAGANAVRRAETHYGALVDQHRPALDAYDSARQAIAEKYAHDADSPLFPHEIEARKIELEAAKKLIPPEIRSAMLQRAYIEGTPSVRRQVLALGYVPTEADRARPVLNILHRFRDEYEPTQKIFTPDELERTSGPTRVIKQGNKKASFDLKKEGSAPDSSLADRVLDRLVRGRRLEEYHASRREILSDLGLGPSPTNTHAVAAAMEAATAAGDTRRAGLLARVLAARNDAAAAAEAKRAVTLRPDAPDVNRTLEFTAPQTAQERALRGLRREGDPGVLPTYVDPKTGAQSGFLRQLDRGVIDLRTLVGRGTAQAKAIGPLRKIVAQSAKATEETASAAAALRKAERANAASRARKAATSVEDTALTVPGNGPDGAVLRPEIHPPHTENTFNDGKTLVGSSVPHTQAEINAVRAALNRAREKTDPRATIEEATQRLDAAQSTVAGPLFRATKDLRRAAAPRSLRSIIAPSRRTEKLSNALLDSAKKAANKTRDTMQRNLEQNDALRQARDDAAEAIESGNTIGLPQSLDHRLFGDKAVYEKGLLSAFSDLQRDALFVLPFAHMKNISVLAALGPGGMNTVRRGIKYAHDLRTNPSSLASRQRELEGLGATTHYIAEAHPVYEKIPKIGKALGRLGEASNKALERYDLGMRLALQDELRAKGVTGFEAGGQIRDVLGDYANQAPAIKFLRTQLGANFPGWRLGIVPRAMTKAIREQPRAVDTYARSQRLASDDVTQPLFGTDFDMGGPAEDYSKMVEVPLTYGLSESTLGPTRSAFDLKDAMQHGRVTEWAAQQAKNLVPLGSLVGAATNFPFPSNAPAAASTVAGLAGAYFPNAPALAKRSAQLRNLGMEGTLVDQLRWEGLLPPLGAQSGPAPLPVAPPPAVAGNPYLPH